MPKIFQHTEGIILRVIPFRDYDQILTLFTSDYGIIKLFYYGSRSKRCGVQGLCIPLTKVEVIFIEKKGEIFNCQEMSLLDSFFYLRKEIHYLETACDLLNVIAYSQLAGKPAAPLYALLCCYLQKIPFTAFPSTLAVSFRLKLLKHDGWISFPFICNECGQVLLSTAYIYNFEGWCVNHQPIGSKIMSQKDLEQVTRLATSQSFRDIRFDEVSSEIKMQVAGLFEFFTKK